MFSFSFRLKASKINNIEDFWWSENSIWCEISTEVLHFKPRHVCSETQTMCHCYFFFSEKIKFSNADSSLLHSYTLHTKINKLQGFLLFFPPREFYLITENSAGDLQLAVQLWLYAQGRWLHEGITSGNLIRAQASQWKTIYYFQNSSVMAFVYV